jgi:nucleoside-diphosphate-sugar epimerase
MKKNVLITGATGAIGKAVIKLLCGLDYNIVGQYNTN